MFEAFVPKSFDMLIRMLDEIKEIFPPKII
jgi:hypothetical protein